MTDSDTTQDARTDRQIVDQTEKLAREFLAFEGWAPDASVCDFKTYKSTSTRAQKAWRMACIAQEVLTAASADAALTAIE